MILWNRASAVYDVIFGLMPAISPICMVIVLSLETFELC